MLQLGCDVDGSINGWAAGSIIPHKHNTRDGILIGATTGGLDAVRSTLGQFRIPT